MRAKVFQSGNSLAVRLPKSLNLRKNYEFEVKQVNQSIVLTPSNTSWENLFSAVDSFCGEIKREQLPIQDREWQK